MKLALAALAAFWLTLGLMFVVDRVATFKRQQRMAREDQLRRQRR